MTLPEYKLLTTLPRMAWGAVIESAQAKAVVYHGSGVETRERWFVEGAWNGPFGQGGLEEATVMCGTGGVMRDGEWWFCGSTDRLAPLFSLEKDGRIHVSNSHIFAMSLAGEKPDACYPFYFYDIMRIWRHGLLAMDGSVRLSSNCRLGVHFSCMLKVGTHGKINFSAHPAGPQPRDFRSYKHLLDDGLKAVLANAANPSRQRPLGSICALSKGYDTNATAALAGKAGCRQAYSFIDPRQEDPRADSGYEHAAVFGMSCEEISRLDYLADGQLDEAEFCLMPLASQVSLAAVAGRLEGKILLCGNAALAWKPFFSLRTDQRTESSARIISGLGQLDFRLRTGYVVFSPATIGMEHNRAICRISQAEEMRPWMVGGKYDRPLARRIAEEAGLPRKRFGMVKHGFGHVHLTSDALFSPAGWRQYQEFLTKLLTGPRRRALLAYWQARVHVCHGVWRFLGCYGYRPRRIGPISRHFLFLMGTHPRMIPWPCHFLFQWSCDRLRARYAIAGKPGAVGEAMESMPGRDAVKPPRAIPQNSLPPTGALKESCIATVRMIHDAAGI